MSDIEKKAEVIKQISDVLPRTTVQVDKALSNTVRAINAALVSIKPMIWGLEKISDWLDKKLPEKLENIPPENIIVPPINIAGPTIEAMRFTAEDELRNMYANLLAASMNSEIVNNVHPRFIEVIKNLTNHEALILNELALSLKKCLEDFHLIKYNIFIDQEGKEWDYFVFNEKNLLSKFPFLSNLDYTEMLLNNLCSLGILNYSDNGKWFPYSTVIAREMKFIDDSDLLELIHDDKTKTVYTKEDIYYVTSFGYNFLEQIVKPK